MLTQFLLLAHKPRGRGRYCMMGTTIIVRHTAPDLASLTSRR
jgi:hypothetical protein